MGKYHQTIDIDGHNSAAHILKNVRPNSTVVEFGPASGYMTQYLKESLNCKVIIVELDYNDGLEASQYAEESLIGYPNGDIEMWQWINFDPVDHVIFADVLEHLRDPWKVLQRAAKIVKDDGSIFISIPNVGHNSVIIDLINDKFNYRPTGLLDNTHLRFFTRKSLAQMVVDAGLVIENEFNTYCAVEHTEFKNSFDEVPEPVAEILKARPDGNLYQFVWELKKE
jgi:O-antigen biosynthesis protein